MRDRLPLLKAKAQRAGWWKFVRSEADERAVLNGCRFSERHAEFVTEFFRTFLCHSKGKWAGQPFELLDWQRDDIVFPLFGWLRADGTRRFRRAYIEIPKKNGKSTLAAGIGLYMLVGDGEAGAEVYSAATDKDQAAIVHNEAITMVDTSPALKTLLRVNRSTHAIHLDQQNSTYRAISAKPAGKEGLNGHCCICDELHVWYGRDLWDALRFMGRARSQSLIFAITTAGDDLLSVCREQHEYADGLLKGTITDDRFFAYIRDCTPEQLNGDGLFDEANWRHANPSLGITIDVDEFRADVVEASKTPTSMASMMRYSFNVWTTGTTPWLNLDQWDACRESFDAESLAGLPCWAGLDLAKIADMSAFVLVFPDAQDTADPVFRVLPFFWLPQTTAEERDERMLAPYLEWHRQGLLTLTEGNVTDYQRIEDDIAALAKRFSIQGVAFDNWGAAEHLTQRLESVHGLTRFEFRQSIANFANPTAEFERLVVGRRLKHNGHALLRWQAGNVNVKEVNGNKRPVKPPSGDHRKIDGIVSAIMALDRTVHEWKPPPQGSLLIT